MTLYVKGTDIQVVGTLETIQGVAIAFGLNEDGSPEYAGETKIWWDDQRTIIRDGERIWVDDAGTEYPQSQIESREE